MRAPWLGLLLLLTLKAPGLAQGTDWLALAKALDASDKEARLAAVRTAAALREERTAAYLAPVLSDDRDRDVRAEAARALARIPGPEAVRALTAGMKDSEVNVRLGAVLALGTRLGPPESGRLLPALKDPDAGVRQAALYALGAVGGEEAISALAGVAGDGDNKRLRALAADILGQMGDRSALPELVAALEEADQDVLGPALKTALRKILAQTPARLKAETEAVATPPAATPSSAAKAKPTSRRETVFRLSAPQARRVTLEGNFIRGQLPMRRDAAGIWSLAMPMPPGLHRYRFDVDGEKTTDPGNPRSENGFSVLETK
ncbi:MAG: HEAT repeat domain-containing protein [Elusimicrobia bacterium]|nr:HEAT repeat domain-containing protein [Elusimicrobiota bacterium]